uniref:Uncharacterized protein n=1 Tax=Rangifer tarandus platyrhynchus TaxID=3082113 RepID=A0ACB0E9J8_RANTA|nr:unnamed protein product [Rangifer tarandus platyrhynchus]
MCCCTFQEVHSLLMGIKLLPLEQFYSPLLVCCLRDARRGSLPDPLCEQLADTTFRAQAALHVLRVYPRDADPPTVPGPRPRSRPSEATGSRLKAVGYGCSAPETLSAT